MIRIQSFCKFDLYDPKIMPILFFKLNLFKFYFYKNQPTT